MPHISIKPGDSLMVGEDVTIQFDAFTGGRSHLNVEDAYGDVSVVRGRAPEPTKEEMEERLWTLAREIVSGLSGLEAAESKELLENFEELRRAWRGRKISLRVAAEACGIPQSTFYDAVVRAESAEAK